MPMDVFEALSTTRAVRRFTDEPVSDADIMTCIRAATQAPSGGNIQPWQFLVVTDAATRRALGQVYRRAYDRYEPALLGARPPARTPAEEASFARMRAASRHLAEHLGEAPALVLVLMPNISMTLGAGGCRLLDIQRARWKAVAAGSMRSARGGGPSTPRASHGMRTSAVMRGWSAPK